MTQELRELKQAADEVFAEWEKTKSADAMNRWLEIYDAIMAIGWELGG